MQGTIRRVIWALRRAVLRPLVVQGSASLARACLALFVWVGIWKNHDGHDSLSVRRLPVRKTRRTFWQSVRD